MRVVFGSCELDLQASRLLRNGREVALEPKAFALLSYLAQHPGRLLTKEELLREVWRVESLSDGVITNAIAKLRSALGQRPEQRAPIETVHGRGYRFHVQPDTGIDASRSPAAGTEDPSDPFVGRTRGFEVLSRKLERTKRGAGCLVLLAASAGMGKTRTAKELAKYARARGVRVAAGSAHDGADVLPYWPWVEILRNLQRELGRPAWQRCVPREASAIWHLLPELRSTHASSPPIEPEAARFQLFDEVARLLNAASAGAPLLLSLDDLQWADEGSLELLAFAARALQAFPVMFLASVREDESALDGPRHAALQRLGRESARVPLPPLSCEDVIVLSTAVAGADRINTEMARAIYERTGGNPLFVRQFAELIQHADRAGQADPSSALPPIVSQVLRQKLALLDQDARTSLAAAAVIGQEFSLALLAEVLDRPPQQVLAELAPALRIRVLEPIDGTENFAFAHALLREAQYEDLGVLERGGLHRRIADVLASRSAAGFAVRLGEIARHYLKAVPSCLDQALRACRAAATAAEAAAGFESACELLSSALRKWDAEGGDLETRFDLLIELGTNYFFVSAFERAWKAYREAAETARRLHRADLLAHAVPHLVNCVECLAGDIDFVIPVMEEALAGLSEGQGAWRAIVLAHRAELATELAREERAELLRLAAALAERSGVLFARMEVAHSRVSLRDPTTLDENAEAAAHLLELLARHPAGPGPRDHRATRYLSAYATEYLCALTRCDIVGADRALARVRDLAERSKLRVVRLALDWLELGRALGDGRLADVEHILRAAQTVQQAGDALLTSRVYGSFLSALLEAQERFAELALLEIPDSVMQTTARHGPHIVVLVGSVYARTGRLQRARDCLAMMAPNSLARMPVHYGDLGALCGLAEAYCALDDREGAAWVYRRLQPFEERNAVLANFEYWGAVAHYLGLLARRLGDESTARAHFSRALAINRALNMPLRVARTQRELAAT